MRRVKNITLLSLVALVLLNLSCGSDGDDGPGAMVDNFDRSAMLEDWRTTIITPAVNNFGADVDALNVAVDAFIVSSDQTNLNALRTAWVAAYRSWQSVSMFEIGAAEALNLRNFMNVFPVDVDEVQENIMEGGYNFELPSTNDQQGFPALDYLINGLAGSDDEILAFYTADATRASYTSYMSDVMTRMESLTTSIVNYWNNEGGEDFVQNSGSSGSASVNKLVNDFMFYYEKSLRAGKVGIPAGVFSGNPLSQNVEAFYRGDISKTLLLDALDATQNFFNGRAFGGNTTGESLKSYLDFLNTIREGEDLSTLINNQFNSARTAIQSLDDDFRAQIANDNQAFLAAYDELQKAVVLLKVDMLQALNIQVDFVDADGD